MTTRTILVILLCVGISVAGFAQAPVGTKKRAPSDWGKVERIRGEQPIRVLLNDGRLVEGRFGSADADAFRMIVSVGGGLGSYRKFKREEVARLWKIHIQQKPISGGRLMLDSALGVAAGAGIGAIVDSQYPNNGEGYGKIAFGLLGMVFGPLVDAIAGSPMFHRPKLVYEVARQSAEFSHSFASSGR